MRRSLVFAALLCGLVLGGCHPERRQITPTTLGTDLKRMPRGQMTPYSWPGQDIVKATPPATTTRPPGEATIDPGAAMASGETIAR
jgi:hypothetical protein